VIDAKTRYIVLIGDPVEHSLAPIVANAVFEREGANYAYIAVKVRPEDLESAIAGLKACGVVGLAVTIPHKIEAMKYIDEADDFAELVGALNLIHFKDGRAIGYNTDGYGALKTFEEEGITLNGKKVVILGAGGAGTCMAYQALLAGAGEVVILNRTAEKAYRLVENVKKKMGCCVEGRIGGLPLTKENVTESLQPAEVLIHTTSVGMYPNEAETLVRAQQLRPGMVVYDLIYNPLKTQLLKEAEKAEAIPINGLGMLVYTCQRAVQVCTSIEPPLDLMKRVAIEGRS